MTRKNIVDAASLLFNSKGYKATSISDITNLAGITKGALYKHFIDKSGLEKECLVSMTNVVMSNVIQRIKEQPDAPSKLISVLDYFQEYAINPPFAGGCPLMNAAVEMDDTNKELKAVVAAMVAGMQKGISSVIQNGIERQQLESSIEAHQYATVIFSSLEGGVMVMKISDSPEALLSIVRFLKTDILSKVI